MKSIVRNLRSCKNRQEQVLPIEADSKKIPKRSLSVGEFFKLSKSDSLDSNYSRMTSIFGLGSRQSSQDTNFEHNQKKIEVTQGDIRQNSKELAAGNNEDENVSDLLKLQGKAYLFLKRANAIEEVSPSLERSNVPNIIVHRAENSRQISGETEHQ